MSQTSADRYALELFKRITNALESQTEQLKKANELQKYQNDQLKSIASNLRNLNKLKCAERNITLKQVEEKN